MDDFSNTIDLLADRMETISCKYCGCEIDVSDLSALDMLECPECALPLTVLCRLGAYMLEDRLGAGAMGTIYKGKDIFLDREVAIKVLNRELGQDIETVEKFKKEAAAIAQLNHPNIARVFAFGEQKGQPYLVMEYLPGDSLKDMMDKNPQMDEMFVIQTGVDIARALEAASEIFLIHGDVKPENIAFGQKSTAKLVDFGLATFGKGRAEAILGTPYYIAPEKVLMHRADTRADMYSLGATLYHALAGTPPFTGDTPAECAKARLKHDPPPLSRYRKNVNSETAKIITRLMQRDQDNRYPNYTSLVKDLEMVLNNLGKPAKKKQIKTANNKHATDRSPRPKPTAIKTANRSKPAALKTATSKPKPSAIKTTRPRQTQIKTAYRKRPPTKTASAIRTGSGSRRRPTASAGSRHTTSNGPSRTPAAITAAAIGVVIIMGMILSQSGNRNTRRSQPARSTSMAQESHSVSPNIKRTVDSKLDRINTLEKDLMEAVNGIKALHSETTVILDSSIAVKLNKHNKIISARAKATKKIVKGITDIKISAKSLADSISTTKNPQTVKMDLADLTDLVAKTEKLKATTVKLLEECQAADRERQRIHEDINKAKMAEKEAREKEEKARAAAKKKAEEEAEARRLAEEKAKQEAEDMLEQELQSIPVAYTQAATLIRINEFEKALDGTINRKFAFKANEARVKIQPLIERCGRMKRWKDWLTLRLMDAPLPNGWTEDGIKYTINTANETGLRISGGKGFVLWRDVPPTTMLGFFNYFVAKKELQPPLEAELQLAAMTYAYLINNPGAMKTYYEKAIALNPTLAHDPDVVQITSDVRQTTEQIQTIREAEVTAQNAKLMQEEEERKKRLAPLQQSK